MTGIGVKRFNGFTPAAARSPGPCMWRTTVRRSRSTTRPSLTKSTGERGIPGQAINCKCTMAPVFDFSDAAGDE
jgi:hypothetical protein